MQEGGLLEKMASKPSYEELEEELGQVIYEISSSEMDQFIDEFKLDIRKPRKWDELDSRAKLYWCLKADRILLTCRVAICKVCLEGSGMPECPLAEGECKFMKVFVEGGTGG